MTSPTPAPQPGIPHPAPALRPAVESDCKAIARIWERGWRDGHLGHVPTALVRHRQPAGFYRRVPDRLDVTTVAVTGGRVVGFVMVVDDEIEQIYVDAPARGTGIATALLAHGEAVVAADGFDRAWLAVVAGNLRARRFYERHGWSDTGGIDYPAATTGPGDATVIVPAHRYEKRFTEPVAALRPSVAVAAVGSSALSTPEHERPNR